MTGGTKQPLRRGSLRTVPGSARGGAQQQHLLFGEMCVWPPKLVSRRVHESWKVPVQGRLGLYCTMSIIRRWSSKSSCRRMRLHHTYEGLFVFRLKIPAVLYAYTDNTGIEAATKSCI